MIYKITITKSIRNSIALRIDNKWNLIIKAPFFITKNSIDIFIEKHRLWIEKKRSELKNKISTNFECWNKILFLWKRHKINKKNIIKEGILLKDNIFYLDKNLSSFHAKEIIIKFYKIQAKKYIINKTLYFIKKYSLEVHSIKVGSAKSRWWSCSSNKNIRFTYLLMSAPLLSIDYVIIHELAHLKEMNHSKAFWSEVERMMNDYKIYKEWFKKNRWIKIF